MYSAQLHPIIDPVVDLDKKWALSSVSWQTVVRWGEAARLVISPGSGRLWLWQGPGAAEQKEPHGSIMMDRRVAGDRR